MKKRLNELKYVVEIKKRGQADLSLEIIKDVLINEGMNPSHFSEHQIRKTSYLTIYVETKPKAQRIEARVSELKLRSVSVKITHLSKCNWQDEWKRQWKPFFITKDVEIIPAWMKREYRPKGTPVYIDSTFAFGTGLHETTQLMAGIIAGQKGKMNSFLDIGAGTGILSILAHHYGAKDIDAFDVCNCAVKTAQKNFRLNSFRPRKIWMSDLAQESCRRRYDLIAANLFSHDLKKMSHKIISFANPNGFLAVSGIALEHLPSVKKVYRRLLVSLVKEKHLKNWAALLYQKQEGVNQ